MSIFGPARYSTDGHAVGLNMVNHRGAMATTPGMRDMIMPTSIIRLGLMAGSAMSKYIRPLPTGPPNSPLSVLPKRGDATHSAAKAFRLKAMNSSVSKCFIIILYFFI